MTTVQCIILNWRTAEMTLRSVAAALVAMEEIAGEITVVDNDSGDGSFEAMTAAVAANGWDRVRVLQSGRNGGFGAGNNHGIRAGMAGGRPDFVYILNSDAFPAPDAIRALLAHLAAHPEADFAGSHIHGEDGETHLTTFRFPGIASEFEGAARIGVISRLLGRYAVPLATPSAATRVDWLAGASMMARRDTLDRIGIFDEEYFLYYEETDLCLRLARAGGQVHFVPASRVAHIGSVSTGMKEWKRVPGYWYDSRWRYFAKNHGRAYAACATAAHLAGAGLFRLRQALSGRRADGPPDFLRSMLRHDLSALRDRPAPARAVPAE